MPDWTKAARRPSDREEIVDYVFSTPPGTPEPNWLEWKTEYDLTTVPGRLAVARQIIGFANRHPDRAAQHAEGLGYLLLGVEPQNLVGISEHDSADLENWISPYVGQGIAWDPEYVRYSGKSVLFITVEAPRWGDPIHSLRQEAVDISGRSVLEGTIWVRKLGKTARATSVDIDMLSERAKAGRRTLSLSLAARQREFNPVAAELLSDDWRTEVTDRLRREYLSQVPSERASGFPIPMIDPNETRRPREFVAEVERWIGQLRQRWHSYIAVGFVEDEHCPLDLEVVNDTDDVFESVQVEVTFPLRRVWLYLSGAEARKRLHPPEPPAKWGERLLGSLAALGDVAAATGSSGTEIEEMGDGGPVLVRFSPLLIRPRSRHPLTRLLFALPPMLAGKELPTAWRATSRSTSGEIKGELRLKIAPDRSARDTPAEEPAN